jgi:hypothetical protein
MRRLLLPVFLVLLLADGVFIVATSSTLPERVASHFIHGGQANGWMPRESYVMFILGAAVLVPLVVATFIAWLPRAFPRAVNLPNRMYWFDPDRRDATFASLSTFAFAFGSVLSVLIAGLHWAVVQANARNPPVLAESAVNALLAAFAVAIVVWLIAWFLRFRRPRAS